MKTLIPALLFLGATTAIRAHEWSAAPHAHSTSKAGKPAEPAANANAAQKPAPTQAIPFAKFAPKVNLRWDEKFLYVESNGLPSHQMMVGITAWQQQVPLPQDYTGDNAWRIPLSPVPAKEVITIKDRFLRGAVALAVNGIPIFNPQNNRGEISQEIGELDEWGGHCGRADDYHYHAAPLHLQQVAGKAQPIAFALDGYPIYGLTEPDGSQPAGLDVFNGHTTKALGYHYHASTKYPYVNGGFHGEVVERDGQVDPQPRANGVREALPALRGAKITGFESIGANRYNLSYEVNGEKRAVQYAVNPDGTFPFEFQNGNAGTTKEVYKLRQRDGGRRSDGDRPPRRERGGEPRPGESRPKHGASRFGPDAMKKPDADFVAAIPEEKNGGNARDNSKPEQAKAQPASCPQPRPAADDRPPQQRRPGGGKGTPPGLIKPSIADTMKLNVYADNWFMLYVNGRLVAVDPIQFTPHNVVSVDFLPEYPMAIAVLAKDNADPKTGLEYGTSIGDGGFVLKFGDGTVTNASWKAKSFFHGPASGDTANPEVIREPLPANWWGTDFDDSTWNNAKEYTVGEVDPKQPYFDHDFEGAKFIWSDDIALDNTVIFRARIEKPRWTPRWNTKPDLDVAGVDAGATGQ